jgi:hypothetical protein
MFSTGIKNFILILIIILIFHFLIKKALLSRREGFVCKTHTTQDGGSGPSPPPAPKPKEEQTLNAPKSTNDIYDMWFGEAGGGQADKSLDSFFKGELDMSKEAEEAAKCKVRPGGDLDKPISTTCDPKFDMSKGEADAKPLKANCDLMQDKKGMMILNEYENENNMNGGKLHLNLDAYDRDDYMYASL